MTETVIITGSGLTVEHRQPTLFDQRAALATDRETERRRHRPATPTPAPAAPTGVDLVATIEALGRNNPYWTTEANDWADAHPEVRPKDAARKWRNHRIETT